MVYDLSGNVIGEVNKRVIKQKPNNSFLHISFDDVQYCIKNLAENTFNSIFDEPFFAMLKAFHDKYNANFSLYLFHLSTSGFRNISTKYQKELIANSDWLKFGFHQYTTGSLDTDEGTAKWYYEYFVDGIYNMCGGPNSIDRIPRLDYYGGDLEVCQGLRDAKMGITGLLSADNSRLSYYLTQEQADYIRKHGVYYDRTNGLVFFNTDFRIDWFISGFTSQNEYIEPVKDNPYDELVYRYGQAGMGETLCDLIVFVHEWKLYSSSYVLDASVKDMIDQVCRFAVDYNYDFDFPMNRAANITSYTSRV